MSQIPFKFKKPRIDTDRSKSMFHYPISHWIYEPSFKSLYCPKFNLKRYKSFKYISMIKGPNVFATLLLHSSCNQAPAFSIATSIYSLVYKCDNVKPSTKRTIKSISKYYYGRRKK